jgi:hypothetical protein
MGECPWVSTVLTLESFAKDGSTHYCVTFGNRPEKQHEKTPPQKEACR